MVLARCQIFDHYALGFSGVLPAYLAALLTGRPGSMKLSSCERGQAFILSGVCPHCHAKAAFGTVNRPYVEMLDGYVHARMVGIAQCIACNKYVLAIIETDKNGLNWSYKEHFPLATPDQNVEEQIPIPIAEDFKEALRCRWVSAWNATAEMCRRAVEASCIDLKAPKNPRGLDKKIDWLADQGIITPFLQEVAHKVRLGGNRGAHPDEDDPLVITEEHADAIVRFTREFFHHVYVVRKELDKYDFSKAAKKASTQP